MHYTIAKSFLVVLATLPICSWVFFLKKWQSKQVNTHKQLLFLQKHNCVVTFQANRGYRGWPPDLKAVTAPTLLKTLENLIEPLLYFIQTAERSLDMAVMILNLKSVYFELSEALKRGVKVRILCNFKHSDSSLNDIKSLILLGAQCQFFVAPANTLDSIMHHKYIVKDYSEDFGYLCMGSMNLSSTSALNNYESLIFMSDYSVVNAFHSNFQECWNNVIIDNQGLINKTILMDAQLDI